MSAHQGLQLLHFSGLSQRDCSAVYSLLDCRELLVVDVHHGSVYNRNTLSVLLDVPQHRASWWSEQLDALRQVGASDGVSLTVSSVGDADYEAWLSGRGMPHYILTCLAENLSTAIFLGIEPILHKHGLSVESIHRLSGYTAINRTRTTEREVFCLEFTLRGRCADERALRTELLTAARSHDVNLSLQRDDIYRRHRRLLAMDMDSTLVDIEIIDELARLKGAATASKVAELTRMAMDGKLNFEQSLRKRVALLAGIKLGVLERLAKDLPLSEGATTLFDKLHKLGYHTAIISGGFDFFARALQKRLAIGSVYANRLEMAAGELTGRLSGPIIDGEKKAHCLRALVDRLGIALEQSIAIGDGANDIPMIGVAGLGIAYRPRPMLLRSASHSLTRVGLDGVLYLIGLRPVHD